MVQEKLPYLCGYLKLRNAVKDKKIFFDTNWDNKENIIEGKGTFVQGGARNLDFLQIFCLNTSMKTDMYFSQYNVFSNMITSSV